MEIVSKPEKTMTKAELREKLRRVERDLKARKMLTYRMNIDVSRLNLKKVA